MGGLKGGWTRGLEGGRQGAACWHLFVRLAAAVLQRDAVAELGVHIHEGQEQARGGLSRL